MAKEVWTIDKFEGGLNDFTDPKDLAKDEFVELQDCSVGKIGQIKNLGKPVESTTLPSVLVISGVDIDNDGDIDNTASMLAGQGFFRFPNDYALGAIDASSSSVVTLEQTSIGEDAQKASVTFEITNCLWVLSSLNRTSYVDCRFHLRAKNAAGAILPAGHSFDIADVTGWIVMDYYDLASGTHFDNYSYTNAEGSTISPQNVHDFWQVGDGGPYTNREILGQQSYKAFGFYKYTPHPEYDSDQYSIFMPEYEHQAGTEVQRNVNYNLMRKSFIDTLAAKINLQTSTPNVTATAHDFGTGLITLTASNPGTALNGYTIATYATADNASAGAVVVTDPDIKVSLGHTVNTKGTGFATTSGDNVFQGGTAAVACAFEIRVEGPVSNMDVIHVTLEHQTLGHTKAIPGSPFLFSTTHVAIATEIKNSLNGMTGLTATLNTDESQYTLVNVADSLGGAAREFTMEFTTGLRDNFFDTNANDEQHILLTLSDKSIFDEGHETWGKDVFYYDIVGNNGTYPNLGSNQNELGNALNLCGISMKVFSQSTGSWTEVDGTGVFHPTSDIAQHTVFDWVWNAEFEYYPEPSFVNDGNRVIMSDGNFELPNKNIFYGYCDRTNFFPVSPFPDGGPSLWANMGFDYLRKWIKWPERKVWSFTERSTAVKMNASNPYWCWDGQGSLNQSANSAHYGVYQAGRPDIIATLFGQAPVLNSASMAFLFYTEEDIPAGETGSIDWGGAIPPDDEDEEFTEELVNIYKFYLAAVYDDESESLPEHKFLFSYEGYDTDEFPFTYSQYLKLKVILRPMCGAMRHTLTGVDYTAGGLDDSFLMNRLCFPDPRVIGVRLYYTDSTENHDIYSNMGLYHFEKGFIPEGQENITHDFIDLEGDDQDFGGAIGLKLVELENDHSSDFVVYRRKPKGSTYEFFNGVNPKDILPTSIRYKHSTVAGNRLFVANVEVENQERDNLDLPGIRRVYNDRMVMSSTGKYSTLPYPNNVFDLSISDGDEITSLESVDSKILEFKRSMLYIVDISSQIPSQFYIEKRLRHKGVLHKNHTCETQEGIFFFNKYGAWIYNGDELKDIFVNKDENDKKQQRIDPVTWDSFVTYNAMCEFNPLTNEVIILKTHTQAAWDGSDEDTKSDGDCYIYHVLADAWTYGKGRFHAGHTSGTRQLSSLSHIGQDFNLGFLAKADTLTLQHCKLFLWDSVGQGTDNFRIVTGVTNLGDAYSFKSIMGVIVNVVEETASSPYTLTLYWRTGPGDDWNSLDTIASTGSTTSEALSHSIIYNPPSIKGVKTFQLKIEGSVTGDFGINDINIVFRKYRSSSLNVFRGGVED